MILVIRHAQKDVHGNLTKNGRRAATGLGRIVRQMGFADAIVAPNDRCSETARKANLRILGEEERLAIPDGYEEYLNKVVVTRMLEQEGEPWEKSFTRAVLEDPLYDSIFASWGALLTSVIVAKEVARNSILRFQGNTDGVFENNPNFGYSRLKDYSNCVFIGSSPVVELAYLALIGSSDWRDFPRCRELEGFTLSAGTVPNLFKL